MSSSSVHTPYLEVTFRHGRPLAGYLYLRGTSERTVRSSRRLEAGLVADLDQDGAPIGIEITTPGVVTADILNRALRELGVSDVSGADLGPLLAA